MIFFVVVLFAACSAKSSMPEMAQFDSGSFERHSEISERTRGLAYNNAAVAEPEEAAPLYGETTQRKLVKRANIRVRVEDLAAADASIKSLMEKFGAYAASTEIEENSRNYSIRVPAPDYDAFLAAMEGMGRILRRAENTEDVTLRYYDLESRLATKQELLKTFQAYLSKAKNIEEILSVETRIAELQNEIDFTGNDFRALANTIDYATVDLDIFGPMSIRREATLAERAGELLGGFGSFISTAALVLMGIIIYGIPVLLLAVFMFWLLLGRVGLLKKLARAAAGKKTARTADTEKKTP